MISTRSALLAATCFAHVLFGQEAPHRDTTTDSASKQPRGGKAPLVLRIGLPSADSFTFTTRSPTFRTTIPIEADADGEFTLSVSRLIGPDGMIVPVTFAVDSATPDSATQRVTIKRFGGTNLVVIAKLPATGAYRGAVTTVTNAARVTRAFTVSYPRRDRPVRVGGLGAVALDRTSGALDVTVAVLDTSLAAVRLYSPTVESFRRLKGIDSIEVPRGPATVRLTDKDSASEFVDLDANVQKSVTVSIANALSGAGQYALTLRFAGPDVAAFTIPARIFARNPWWCAALVIAAGIFVTELVRFLRDSVRPRLVRQEAAASLLEAVVELETRAVATGALAAEEREVFDSLEREVRKVFDDPALAKSTDADARLDDLSRRLTLVPAWVNLRREISALEPFAVREPVAQRLAPVTAFLTARTTQDVAAENTQSAALQGIPKAIHDAVADDLRKRIDEFKARLNEAVESPFASDVFLSAVAEDLQKQIGEASNSVDNDRLDDAGALLETARGRFAELLTRDLELRVSEPTPGWMSSSDWTQVADEVKRRARLVAGAGSPDQKLAAYNSANASYLNGLATSLVAFASAADQTARDQEKPLLETMKVKGRAAQARIAVADLNKAASAVDEAITSWKAISALRSAADTEVPKAGPADDEPSDSVSQVAVPGPAAARGTSTAIARVVLPTRIIAARLTALDWLTRLLGASLALALGLLLLWKNDLVWGTTTDMLTAFLWGAGLQQVGSETFRGVADIIARVGKPT